MDFTRKTDNINLLISQGLQHYKNKDFTKAQADFEQVLKLSPTDINALNLLGVVQLEQGHYTTAEQLISKALAYAPQEIVFVINLGLVYQQQHKYVEALHLYQNNLYLEQDNIELNYNLAIVLQKLQQYNSAIDAYQKVINLNPQHCGALNNIGSSYLSLRNLQLAKQYFEQAITVNHKYHLAYNNLGTLYLEHELNFAKALAYFKQAINANGYFWIGHFNLANTLRMCKRWQAAEEEFLKFLEIKPNYAPGWYYLGTIYQNLSLYQKAIQCYEKAIALDNTYAQAMADLFHVKRIICDWQELCNLELRLDDLIHTFEIDQINNINHYDQINFEDPLIHISRSDNMQLNHTVAYLMSCKIVDKVSGYTTISKNSYIYQKKRPLQIGYLSGDFHDHATSQLLKGLLEKHTREDFCINLYSYGIDDNSNMRKSLINIADSFVDLQAVSNIDAANKIIQDQVDILIDLKGHTQGNRLEICALQPAPLQLHYLGFPGTLGAKFIDYIILDKVICKLEDAKYIQEQVIYMPDSYQVNDNMQPIALDFSCPSELKHLAADQVIFASFNQAYKVSYELLRTWASILHKVNRACLWILLGNKIAEENFIQAMARLGINSERIIFANFITDKSKHLARMQYADIMLDTIVYNGHTTTCDALWAGVPVLTVCGKHIASRVSASLLQAVHVPECILFNLQQYQDYAIQLGNNPELIAKLKNKLLHNNEQAPLFDTLRFTANIEKAFKHIWEVYQQGTPATTVDVQQL